MTELYLDKEKSERVHAILINRFWNAVYPELESIIHRLQAFQLSEKEKADIEATMDDLMMQWGFRYPRHPETHKGFVFQDDAAYAQFLLRWS